MANKYHRYETATGNKGNLFRGNQTKGKEDTYKLGKKVESAINDVRKDKKKK